MQKMVSHAQMPRCPEMVSQTPEIKIHYFEDCKNKQLFVLKILKSSAAFGSKIVKKQYCFFIKNREKTVPMFYVFFFIIFHRGLLLFPKLTKSSTAFAVKIEQKQY